MAQQGLFGMYDPNAILEQRNQQLGKEAYMASQGGGAYAPLLNAAYRMGDVAGAGIGRLFGLQDPVLKKAAEVDAATKAVQSMDIDLKDPSQLYPAMIQELQKRGLADVALPLVKQYQDILGSKADIAYKEAGAARWSDDKYEYKQDYLGRVMVLDKQTGKPLGFYSAKDFKQAVVPEGTPAPSGSPSTAKPTAKPKERRPITDANE